MKKIWLLTTLLIGGLLLTGCNKSVENCEISGECIGETDMDVLEWKCWEYLDKNFVANGEFSQSPSHYQIYMNSWDLEYIRLESEFIDPYYWIKWYIKVWDLKQDVICNIYPNWWIHNIHFYSDTDEPVVEEPDDIMNDEKLLSLYPWIQENGWNVIIWDTLQTNYVNWSNTIYYDPYRWIAFILWAEFDWWLIREIDTDEWGFPHSEIILLVKWEENEENRTWINWFREVYTIRVDSKTNLENFNVNPDFANEIWENNEYYFIWGGIDTKIHFSDLIIFDVEEN